MLCEETLKQVSFKQGYLKCKILSFVLNVYQNDKYAATDLLKLDVSIINLDITGSKQYYLAYCGNQ